MNLFKELFKFGFSDLEEVKIFTPKEKGEILKEDKKIQVEITDILYDKTFECPVCDRQFKSKVIKSGRNKFIRADSDLKPYYEVLDPSLYEVLHCSCGYTGLTRNFMTLTPTQKVLIRQGICEKFKEIPRSEYRTVQEAIELYKLALLNTIIKKGKDGEKGFICLKIAWFYRDLEDEANEKAFLEHAVQGLEGALEKERFPMFNLDENTVTYIVADSYRRLGKEDVALKWLSYLLLSKGVSSRLKERARDLKDLIRDN